MYPIATYYPLVAIQVLKQRRVARTKETVRVSLHAQEEYCFGDRAHPSRERAPRSIPVHALQPTAIVLYGSVFANYGRMIGLIAVEEVELRDEVVRPLRLTLVSNLTISLGSKAELYRVLVVILSCSAWLWRKLHRRAKDRDGRILCRDGIEEGREPVRAIRATA